MAAGSVDFTSAGTLRSGPTLLQRLAAERPGVRVPPETHVFRSFATGLLPRRLPAPRHEDRVRAPASPTARLAGLVGVPAAGGPTGAGAPHRLWLGWETWKHDAARPVTTPAIDASRARLAGGEARDGRAGGPGR